jgi:hypothetical protein
MSGRKTPNEDGAVHGNSGWERRIAAKEHNKLRIITQKDAKPPKTR